MPRKLARVAFVIAAAGTGCASLIGLPDYGGSGGAGAAGTGAVGHGATGTGAQGTGAQGTGGKGTGAAGTGATGTGAAGTGAAGTGAASSTGTGGAPACVDGAACYFGLDGTEGVGSCKGGTLSCEGGVGVCSDTRPQVQQCGSGMDENCDGLAGCTGQPRWAQSLPNTTSTTVAAALDGTVALAGVSTLDPGFFVQTYDAHGRPCWNTVFNGSDPDAGGGAALNPLGAAFARSKTTPDGQVAQVECNGGGGTPLAADTIVVGLGTGTADFDGKGQQAGPGGQEAWIARLDPTGKVVWGALFGSNGADDADAVAVDKDGNLYVTGRVSLPLTALPCTGGMGFDAGSPGIGGAFVIQVHPDGTCGWVKHFQGPARGTGIAVDDNGNVTVAGVTLATSGPIDFDGQPLLAMPGIQGFIVQLDPTGTLLGPAIPSGCLPGSSNFVALTPQGAVTMCQSNPGGACAGGTNPMVTLYNVATHGYSCYVSASGPAIPLGLAADRAGNLVALLVAYGTVSSPDWGASTIANGGLVAFKVPSANNVPPVWGYAYGLGSGAQGYGLAVDGMGDVVIGVTPNDALSVPPFTLAGGTGGVFELAP